MPKSKLPSQPKDTTGEGMGGSIAPQKKDSYNSDNISRDKNFHQGPKNRQDGKGSGRGNVNAGDHLWKYKHSTTQGPVEC